MDRSSAFKHCLDVHQAHLSSHHHQLAFPLVSVGSAELEESVVVFIIPSQLFSTRSLKRFNCVSWWFEGAECL